MIFWDPSTYLKVRPQPMACIVGGSQHRGPELWAIDMGNCLSCSGFRPVVGQLVTVSNRFSSIQGEAIPTFYRGVYNVFGSANVLTKNIAIYGGADMGILEWGGRGNHTYDGVQLRRRIDRPYPFRLLSTNLDGFHSFSTERGPKLVHSHIAHMGDDFLNIHNRMVCRRRSPFVYQRIPIC